jgi:amino acid adenylation domain-containing protein/thioester reductase-like protein
VTQRSNRPAAEDSLERRLDALTPAQRQLLEQMVAGSGATGSIGRRPSDDAPVSFEQERLWFMNELVSYRQIFHVPVALRLRGPVDADALRRALAGLVRRHEALRTVFRDTPDGLRQVVLDSVEVPLAVDSCRSTADPAAQARRRASAAVSEPFDLGAGPLLRCALYETGPDDHVFVLVQHHIISDYWSLGILLSDLGALYATELGQSAELAPLDLHYPDFAHWQRSSSNRAAGEGHLAYWRDRLADIPEVLDLPTDRPRPVVRSSQGAFQHVEFPAELVGRLRDLAKQESTTLLVAFLAGYVALLSRLARQHDIVVGVPVAGRSRPELQPMIGYFLNWLAIRVTLPDRPSLRQLIQRTGRALTEAMTHQEVPFDLLVQELQPERRPGTTPIFQTSFSLRDAAPTPPRLPGVEVSFADLDGGATHFDLMAELWCEGDRVVGYLPYDDHLFDASTMATIYGWMHRLLAAASLDPDRPVATLPLLRDVEQAQLVGPGPVDLGAVAGTLPGRFAEQAARRPDATAVSDGTGRLSYAELDARANQVANLLRQRGIGPGAIVAIMLDRTVDLVAGILGVLKCGAAYLPIDLDSPPVRTAGQFADCAVEVALVSEHLTDRLPEPAPATVVLDRDASQLRDVPATPVTVDLPPSAPAYVIYTSGSTGTPKGVLVSHANVLRLFSAADRLFDFSEQDTWTLFHSCSFDFSVWELWGALAHGGHLVVVPQWLTRAPDAFAELLEEYGVTVLSQTPSAFGQLSRVVLADPRPLSLRYIVFGGEALEHAALGGWVQEFGADRPQLINMYGITETTVHVTFRRVSGADCERGESLIGESLIGEPLPDLSLYLLDEELQPVPVGIPGEIFVGGAGVALGYQRAPALTAERILPDPYAPAPGSRMYRTGDVAIRRKDGELAYLGRADQQHKIRGHRVEIGEVQAALNRLDQVAEAAVLVTEDRVGSKTLVAYVVPAPDQATTATGVRRQLLRTLPEWMTPAKVVLLDELPLTGNGKLDQRALAARQREPAQRSAPLTPPQGQTASALAAIWAQLLGGASVGAQDDFFALGGHSLMVVQLVSQIRSQLGVEIPMETIFHHAELQAMADAIDHIGSDPPAATAAASDPLPPAEDLAAARAGITDRLADLPRPAGPLPAGPGDAVLLTGATGFLGAFVLAELLSQGATVVCLVRGGEARRGDIVANLRELGLLPAGQPRFEVVDGDVSRPRLGIAPAGYRELCDRVGRVIHTAAWVNHLYPYEQLATVNADSFAGLLEFASAARRKCLTAVSTSAVFESPHYPAQSQIEAAPLAFLPPESSGYARSKAVGELYVEHAAEFGVPAVVVRFPSLYGDRQRYQINKSDYIWSWTRAMLATGSYPESFDAVDNKLFQALPADVAAQVLVGTGSPEDPPGHRFINAIPNVICDTRDLLAGLREAGQDLHARPDREWYALVGNLDAGQIWVAGIATQISRLSDPSSVRQRLHRFRTDDHPTISRLVDTHAVRSPADLAGYVRSLVDSAASEREGR